MILLYVEDTTSSGYVIRDMAIINRWSYYLFTMIQASSNMEYTLAFSHLKHSKKIARESTSINHNMSDV